MLLRLPFLVLGALGLPALVLMSIAFTLAQWRIGDDLELMFPVMALVGLAMMHWLWNARRLAQSDPAPTLLTRVTSKVALLMLPGALVGLALGVYAYDRVVSRDQHARADLGRSFCHELHLSDRRCPAAASACVPRHTFQPAPETYRGCIEARLR